MVGEHGLNMVPLWSSIHIYGYSEEKLTAELSRIRKGFKTKNFHQDCALVRGKVHQLLVKDNIIDAYTLIAGYPPDIRTSLTPLITQLSGSKTIIGTAKATLALLQMIVLGSDALVTGQIKIEGDFHGIHSTIGAPFVIGNKGVDRIIELPLLEEEEKLLIQTAENVNKKLKLLL